MFFKYKINEAADYVRESKPAQLDGRRKEERNVLPSSRNIDQVCKNSTIISLQSLQPHALVSRRKQLMINVQI